MRHIGVVFCLLAFAWTVSGCSSDNGSEEAVCVANTTQECDCVGAAQGVQECKEDGTGYTECDCSSADAAACDCKPGQQLYSPCGLNGNGTEIGQCEDGAWVVFAECDDPDQCKNGDEQMVDCGDNGSGTQAQMCDDGQWSDVGDCVIAPQCGNGTIEGDEECDDGNIEAGDGCSAGCAVEAVKCSCKVTIDGDVLLDEIPIDEDPSNLTPIVRANSKYYLSTTHILVDNLTMISDGITVLSEPFDTFASWHVQSKGGFGSTGISGGALMLGSDHQIVKYNSSIGSFGTGSFSSTFDLYSGPNSAYFEVGPFIVISFAKHMDASEWNTPSIRACGHIVSLPKISDGWHDVSVDIVRPENGQCQ